VTTSRRLWTVAAALWIVAAVVFIAFEAIAAAAVPSYSYVAQYISVLGVPEWSPRAPLMNSAFYLQGAFFLGGAVLAARAVRGGWTGTVFVLLAATNAAGNALIGYVHGFGAFLAICGGNLAVVVGSAVVGRGLAARWYTPIGVMIGIAGLVIGAMLQTYARWATDFADIGLVERACVYTILAWQILTGIVLLTRTRPDVAAADVR
jgi:hypothetical membrane protein